MLELRLVQGGLLKKVVESIKDLVNDANFDCSSTGLSVQTTDSSNVTFVELLLRSEGFEHYRCDRGFFPLGMNVGKLAENLKRAGDDDIITIRGDDGSGTVTFMFENPAAARAHPVFLLGQHNQHNIAGFVMKLMDIESDYLHIPEVEYDAIVRMPSSQFARICKDLSYIGDTVVISVTEEGVEFSTRCDKRAAIVRFQNSTVDEIGEKAVIEMNEPVSMTFALRYLNIFTKATPLSSTVILNLRAELPVVVEYKIAGMGHLRFVLAPEN